MRQTGALPDEHAALRQHEQLIAGLIQPRAYDEPVDRVQRIDTHISTVLLAGDYAYKLRKPVSLGFLDFSTPELRRRDCEEELRLNRRTAADLYLDVVAVTGPSSAPRFTSLAAADALVIDYAVRMLRFDPESTFDHLAQRRTLTLEQIDRLADEVARLHALAQRADPTFGTSDAVSGWILGNFSAMRDHVQSPEDRSRLDALADWSRQELQARQEALQRRVAQGSIREGHGDLHLGNIVMLDGRPVLFDAIEFNQHLRCIDVISDVAFTFMDLVDHGLEPLAWRFVRRYLEITGDYDGMPLLRLYTVYRALVRAKVALIRLHQPQLKHQVRVREHASFEHYLTLAERLQQGGGPILVVMTGLSGSGKSTVAEILAAALGGVRLRSDVERKRLFGLAPSAQSHSAVYSDAANRLTYERLTQVAATVLGAGLPVVVDAASLKRSERRRFVEVAGQLGAGAAIVECIAPDAVLRERVRLRSAAGGDASEATEAVLERQYSWREPLDDEERAQATIIDTSVDRAALDRQCNALATRLKTRPFSG